MNYYEIEDILEYDVDSVEWQRVSNGLILWTELINVKAFMKYVKEMNEKYCEDHNLCPVCRSELVEVFEDREHFGFPAKEGLWICPNGD